MMQEGMGLAQIMDVTAFADRAALAGDNGAGPPMIVVFWLAWHREDLAVRDPSTA
jgi:hypothetical protein